MAEATNDGVRERKCPQRGKRRCARVRVVDIERMCLFERHQGRLLYIDGACRRELNEGMVLLVSGIQRKSERGVATRRLLSVSVCFTHPGGSYVHTRRKRFDVALGLRVINYVWRHRDLQRACVRGIHVYVGCVCVRACMIEIKERIHKS